MENQLPKKYKEFIISKLHRGVELRVHCVTTSIKKLAELTIRICDLEEGKQDKPI